MRPLPEPRPPAEVTDGAEEIAPVLLAVAKLRRVAQRHGRRAVQGRGADAAVHEKRVGQGRGC